MVIAAQADNPRRNSDDSYMRGNVLKNYTACSDFNTLPDVDIAEDLGSGPDHHIRGNLRMAVADLLACSSEGDVVQYGDVVTDNAGLADDNARRMIEHQSMPQDCCGMDINVEYL